MNYLLILIVLLFSPLAKAQQEQKATTDDALKQWGFIEGHIKKDQDDFYYYLTKYHKKPEKLVVFIQGTDPNPLFSYRFKDGKAIISRWFPGDYLKLDSSYAYAVIPKPGMHGVFAEKFKVPEQYYQKNYLGYRVKQIDLAIEDIIKNHMPGPKQVIVYGHSEGATIAAPLAVKNKHITHLGFWSGNVLNNFYEFALFSRIEALQGKKTDQQSHDEIMGLLGWYQSIIEQPESTKIDQWGYTNKKWASFEEAPIDYLLELDIPIYAQFASKDESTPIETAYLLPVQFMQKRKTNLSFHVCIECDHRYTEQVNGKKTEHWEEIFNNFIQWTRK